MKKQLRQARTKLVKWKIYIDRARMYINYINFFMIIFLFVDSLKNYEFSKALVPNSTTGLIILIPLFFLLSLLLGYLDTRLGIRSEESKQNTLKNPIMNEIIERLERIEKKL
jgi:hypothetical protein